MKMSDAVICMFWVVKPSSRHELSWGNESIIARWVGRINKVRSRLEARPHHF